MPPRGTKTPKRRPQDVVLTENPEDKAATENLIDKAATASPMDKEVESIPGGDVFEPVPLFKKAKTNKVGEPENDVAVAPEVENPEVLPGIELDAVMDEGGLAKVGKDATKTPDDAFEESLLIPGPGATVDVNITEVPSTVELESGKGSTESMDDDVLMDNQDLDKQMMPPPGRGSGQPPLNAVTLNANSQSESDDKSFTDMSSMNNSSFNTPSRTTNQNLPASPGTRSPVKLTQQMQLDAKLQSFTVEISQNMMALMVTVEAAVERFVIIAALPGANHNDWDARSTTEIQYNLMDRYAAKDDGGFPHSKKFLDDMIFLLIPQDVVSS